jgi:ribonuclease HII
MINRAFTIAANAALPQRPDVMLAGVDEAGRGPLAGNVVTAAVILDPSRPIAGLNDSKQLSEAKRESLFDIIRKDALAYSVQAAGVAEIDQYNILQATLRAMRRCIDDLTERGFTPSQAWFDGNHLPALPATLTGRAYAIIKGDARVAEISAASILAKVTRDRELIALDAQYPGYGFAEHKGYPSPMHLEALQRLGPTPAHRTSYAPVKLAMSAHAFSLT